MKTIGIAFIIVTLAIIVAVGVAGMHALSDRYVAAP